MNVRFIKIAGKKVAVYEKGNAKTTLLFLHGNSLGATTFNKQLESVKLEGYQRIAIDLFGHGESDRLSAKEEYTLSNFKKIITTVIKELQLNEVVLVGHSFGGHLAIRLAPQLDAVKGVFVFGTPPLGNPTDVANAFQAKPELMYGFKQELTDDEIESLASIFIEQQEQGLKDLFFNLIKKADGNFRLGNAESIGLEPDDEQLIMGNLPYKIGLALGEHDAIVNKAYCETLAENNYWNGRVNYIPEAGHSPQLENADSFNEILLSYLTSLD